MKKLGIVFVSKYKPITDELIKELLDYFDAISCILLPDNGLLIESESFPVTKSGFPISYYYLNSSNPLILEEGRYSSPYTYFEKEN